MEAGKFKKVQDQVSGKVGFILLFSFFWLPMGFFVSVHRKKGSSRCLFLVRALIPTQGTLMTSSNPNSKSNIFLQSFFKEFACRYYVLESIVISAFRN